MGAFESQQKAEDMDAAVQAAKQQGKKACDQAHDMIKKMPSTISPARAAMAKTQAKALCKQVKALVAKGIAKMKAGVADSGNAVVSGDDTAPATAIGAMPAEK